jgi:hypothetical protein
LNRADRQLQSVGRRRKIPDLLIFSITTRDVETKVTLRNQFARGIGVRVVRSLMLAAPSLKREWKPA